MLDSSHLADQPYGAKLAAFCAIHWIDRGWTLRLANALGGTADQSMYSISRHNNRAACGGQSVSQLEPSSAPRLRMHIETERLANRAGFAVTSPISQVLPLRIWQSPVPIGT